MKNQRGITLIALVITIIVLLILAGVSIAMLTGDNGILKKASNSATETNLAADKEAAITDLNAAYTAYMEAKYATSSSSADIKAFNEWIKTTGASYMNSTDHYDFAEGKVTTKSVNSNGKKQTATVEAKGGLSAWADATTPESNGHE